MQGLYLKVKLERDGNFQKIGPKNRRLGLFKVSYECKEVNQMYNSDLGPDGAQVHIRWSSLDKIPMVELRV